MVAGKRNDLFLEKAREEKYYGKTGRVFDQNLCLKRRNHQA
jgi:hypothetical protein